MQDTNITTADYFDAMRTTEAFLPSLRSLDISLLPAAVAGGVVSSQANPLAFYALCAADPMAWIAADIVLAIPFFRNILRRDYRYMNI